MIFSIFFGKVHKMEVLELSPQGLERIEHILAYNEEWASEVIDFLKNNPSFREFAHTTPFTQKPIGYGKLFGEVTEQNPETITEYLLYYICHTQAYTNFGNALWRKIHRMTATEIISDDSIPEKKKEIIISILQREPFSTWEEVWQLDVKGIGLGAKYFIRTYFSDDFLDLTDEHFQKGFVLIYNTLSSKEIVETWTNKKIGYLFCLQVFHHSL
jgi:hypothetical protein